MDINYFEKKSSIMLSGKDRLSGKLEVTIFWIEPVKHDQVIIFISM